MSPLTFNEFWRIAEIVMALWRRPMLRSELDWLMDERIRAEYFESVMEHMRCQPRRA